MMYIATLSFLSVLLTVNSQTILNQSCVTKRGALGTCQYLNQCRKLAEDFQLMQHIDPTVCGFVNLQAVVCCEFEINSRNDADNNYNNNVKESISERMCREYAKYSIIKARPPTLFQDVPDIIEIRDCYVGSKLGEEAHEKEYPHMVTLGYNSSNSLRWCCSGVLISERYVLTSAQCLQDKMLGDVKYVKLGAVSANDNSRYAEIIKVARRIFHPKYTSGSLYYDLGLIRMQYAAQMSPRARPACLTRKDNAPDDTLTKSAYDLMIFVGKPSGKLIHKEFRKFNQENCTRQFYYVAELKSRFHVESQICGEDKQNSLCKGSIGGALNAINENYQCVYDVVGIASYGSGCSSSLYTKVSHFIDWIESVVWPQDFDYY